MGQADELNDGPARRRDSLELTRRTFLGGTAAVLSAGPGVLARSPLPARLPEDEIRVVQIGMQGHYGDIMSGVPRVAGCRLVGVARSYVGEPFEKVRKQPGWSEWTRVFDDYRRMLDETRPHVVSVFMPYAWNGRGALEAARRGCHVISEKPLAGTLEELGKLRAAAVDQGVEVTAMLGMRQAPALMAAREAVRAGRVGEPLLITAQKSYRWGDTRPEYYKRRESYGGSIPWVAIHAIDYIRYVTGLEYAGVMGRQAVKVHRDYPECEDCGALLFEMSNGGQCVLTFDYLRPREADSHGDDRLRVAGSKGIVEVRSAGRSICELVTHEEAAHELPRPVGGDNLFMNFIASLRGGAEMIVPTADAFRATEVALKAREAADTRRTVEL